MKHYDTLLMRLLQEPASALTLANAMKVSINCAKARVASFAKRNKGIRVRKTRVREGQRGPESAAWYIVT